MFSQSSVSFIEPQARRAKAAIPVIAVNPHDLEASVDHLGEFAKNWSIAHDFTAKPGTHLAIPDDAGKLRAVLFGVEEEGNPLAIGKLSSVLPEGCYRFEKPLADAHHALLGCALASYRFDRYRSARKRELAFVLPRGVSKTDLEREITGTFFARDLINTPTNDLGPDELEAAFRKLATKHKARVAVTKGDQLLKKRFPMIHAVGRASTAAPRLLDMRWGKASNPKITLVGKGVCFDTGGLNIKPGNSMALMKKDMGGAANVMALAQMIMAAKLAVSLRVLVPAVENAIAGNAFRPGDILPSRKGISVEIGNTDAEGRLILGDVLTLADEEEPQLIIDMATLTGAARVALGPDLPPVYCDDDDLVESLIAQSVKRHDPLWRMPLWKPYEPMLNSKVADTNHITSGGFAGSVTAALFLKKFVNGATPWMHFDIFGWVPSAKLWAPVGGEAQGIRALFGLIEERFSK